MFEAWAHLDSILGGARTSVDIVDGYIGEDVLALLTKKAPGVEVRILTDPSAQGKPFMPAAKRFASQYGGLQVRGSKAFHDRFVVLDGAELYHFGASLKDLGKRGFMFSRIEEPRVIDTLRQGIEDAWKAGTVLL